MFETDSVPKNWVEKLQRMDFIWVPAHFHVETFVKAGALLTDAPRPTTAHLPTGGSLPLLLQVSLGTNCA
jgi:hypothetical protein